MWNISSTWVACKNDARCTREIKPRIAVKKAEFDKMGTLFTSKLDFNLRKKLVKCYIWSTAFYGAENWTFRKVDQKYLDSFRMWFWRKMEKNSWTVRVRNEEVLHSVKEDVQGGSNMTGTNCDLFTHKSSRSYLNHLVIS